jgi:hypothetical protein
MIPCRQAYTLLSMLMLLSVLLPSVTWAQAASPAPSSSASRVTPSLALRKVQPHLAFADTKDPNPGSGRTLLLTGWIALGVATLAVAQGPLCSLNTYDARDGQRRCVKSAVGIGVAALTLAVPALVLGYRRRSAQNQWKQRHGLSALAMRIWFSTQKRGFLLGYQLAEF